MGCKGNSGDEMEEKEEEKRWRWKLALAEGQLDGASLF